MSLKLSYKKDGAPFKKGEIRPARDWDDTIKKGHYWYYAHSGHFLNITIKQAYTIYVYVDIEIGGKHSQVYLHQESDLAKVRVVLENLKADGVDITTELAEFVYEKTEVCLKKAIAKQ